MATERTPDGGNPLAGIASLINALGGSRTTQSTNPGDTAALQAVIGQLQGADYSKMLESIFQQAAGTIPGLQQSFGNAVGARSGGNSAVQAALSQLLKQTATGAQEQLARQQLQNQQTQAQAAAAIAQATRGTQSTAKTGSNVGDAAKMLAGLQLFGKLRTSLKDSENEGGPLGAIGKALGISGGGAAAVPDLMPASALNLTDGPIAMNGMVSEPVLPADFDQPLDLNDLFGFGGDSAVTGDADMGAIWQQFGDNNMVNTDFMGPPNLSDTDYIDFNSFL